jgi:NADPH-dependent curcumin reductase CurA
MMKKINKCFAGGLIAATLFGTYMMKTVRDYTDYNSKDGSGIQKIDERRKNLELNLDSFLSVASFGIYCLLRKIEQGRER